MSRSRSDIDRLMYHSSSLSDNYDRRQSATYVSPRKSLVTFKVCKTTRSRKNCINIEISPSNTLERLKEEIVYCLDLHLSLDMFCLVVFDKNEDKWMRINDSNPSATISQLKLRPDSILSIEHVHQQSSQDRYSISSTSTDSNNYELILKLCKTPMNRESYISLKVGSLYTLGELRKLAYEKFDKISKNQPIYLWNKVCWMKYEHDMDDITLADLSFESFTFISLDIDEDNNSKFPPGLCGLTNLGDTCFMNSIFQCLSNIPEFTHRILTLDDEINAPIIGVYKQLIKKMWSGQYTVIEPSSLLYNIGDNLSRYARYRQQDAQEFMNYFLHLIHAELTNDKTLITELFYGQIRSTVKCLGCNRIETMNESISFLPLPISKNDIHYRTLLYVKADGEQRLVTIKINSPSITIEELINCFIRQHEPTLTQERIHPVQLVDNIVRSVYKLWRYLITIPEEQLTFLEFPEKLVLEKYIGCKFVDHTTREVFRPPVYLVHPTHPCRYSDLSDQINHLLAHLCSMTNATTSACYLYWTNTYEERYQLSIEASTDEDLLFLYMITIEMSSEYVEIYKLNYNINRSIDNSFLISLLKDFFHEESLEGEYHCSKCPKRTKARQKSDLCLPLPHVLIIQLKRFTYDIHSNDKIDTYISFPLYGLDLNEYIIKDNSNQENSLTKYDLVAVSNHTGSLTSGHYTTYAKNIQNGNWYSFNDKTVQKLHSDDDIITKHAYILVYVKQKHKDKA